MKPVYLLADNHLLSARGNKNHFFKQIIDSYKAVPKAAYIGVANNDSPEFFEMFIQSMSALGTLDCKMITSSFDETDQAFLEQADIVVIGMGNLQRGLDAMKKVGMNTAIEAAYKRGAHMIGISAGAMLLGSAVWLDDIKPRGECRQGLGIVPFALSAHEPNWSLLGKTMNYLKTTEGFGLGLGSGLRYFEGEVEVIRPNVYRVQSGKSNSDWKVRVVESKQICQVAA